MQIKAILDPDEARSVGLDMNGYSQIVNRVVDNSDGENRVTVVAVSKKEAVPVGMITIIKGDCKYMVNSTPIDDASRRQFDQLKAGNSRVCCYDLQYCIRKPSFRTMSVGDALIACGIEAIAKIPLNRSKEKLIWLLLAGSFKNSAALTLYSRFKFRVVAMLDNRTPIMSLSDVESHVESSIGTAERNLEARFLLPALKKQRVEQSEPKEASPEVDQQHDLELDSEGESDGEPEGEPDDESGVESQAKEAATPSASQASVREDDSQQNDSQQSTADVQEENFLERLTFRSYFEHMKWSSNVVSSFVGDQEEMWTNLRKMAEKSSQVRNVFCLAQHCEMVKQMDRIASSLGENPLSVKGEIAQRLRGVGDVQYSEQYVSKMIQFSWCLHRYPCFEQLNMNWSHGKNVCSVLNE